MTIRFVALVAASTLAAGASSAQPLPSAASGSAQPGRSFELAALQQAAIDADPRAREAALLASQSELRQRNIAVARLPSLGVDGQAQYQSDVPHVPLTLPNGDELISPPKATYDGSVRVDQRLFDPSLAAQSELERAQLAEQQARVRTTLFALRQHVNDLFFTAAGLQERAGALSAAIASLEGRLRETETRVREGAALPSDAAAVEAALLERRQDASQIASDRRAALARLARLTGETIADGDTLALPDLADAVTRARRNRDTRRTRPEYDQFARTRNRIARQEDAAAAQDRPRISAFGRAGYGRPGLNFISHDSEAYGLAGVRLQWNAWTWGASARERQALGIQRDVTTAEEQAFTQSIDEAQDGDLETIDRLRDGVALDDRIVALREQVEESTGVRLREGVVTASDYLDRQAELLQARFARAGRRVDLAQASARLLTTLGLEVR